MGYARVGECEFKKRDDPDFLFSDVTYLRLESLLGMLSWNNMSVSDIFFQIQNEKIA